jgi:hypothetical protein
MRRKQWVLVEDLKGKIDLALEHRLISSWDDLGRKLTPSGSETATSPKTIRWWISGSAGHAPSEMPKDAFLAFADLFAAELSDEGRSVVESLVAGPVGELADAIAEGREGDGLLPFLRDAIAGEAELITDGSRPRLIEINRRRGQETQPIVRLQAPFRIEFKPMHRIRSAIVLQNAGLHWASVEASVDRERTAVFVPGLDSDGVALTMTEGEQTGGHRFYCIQCARPLPTALKSELMEPIALDRRVLGMVARFYGRLSPAERRCQVLALRVEAPATPA